VKTEKIIPVLLGKRQHSYAGNILSAHIHSLYSDGLKTPPEIARDASRCGVDVILMSDHNVFPVGFDGYYTFDDKRVLLLTGEEIHDQTREPQKNHLLVFGIHKDFSRLPRTHKS
jgi:predicted metal-dependent phosphoesterase TrpH